MKNKIIAGLIIIGVIFVAHSYNGTTSFSTQSSATTTSTTTVSFPVPEGLPNMTCTQLSDANHKVAQKLSDYLDTIYHSSWDQAQAQRTLASDPLPQEARQVMTVINAYMDSCKY